MGNLHLDAPIHDQNPDVGSLKIKAFQAAVVKLVTVVLVLTISSHTFPQHLKKKRLKNDCKNICTIVGMSHRVMRMTVMTRVVCQLPPYQTHDALAELKTHVLAKESVSFRQSCRHCSTTN